MAQRRSKAGEVKRAVKHLCVAIHAADLRSLREIVRSYPLDYGCRPHAIPDAAGAYFTPALVSKSELERLLAEGLDIEVLFDHKSGDRTAKATVGRGDRFEGGKIPPQGLGSRPRSDGSDIGPIMNPDEINSAIEGLVNEYGIPTFDLPHDTAEGSGSKGGMTSKVDPSCTTCISLPVFTRGNAVARTI